MDRLIFQVSVGKPSKLYEHCLESVNAYCKKHDIAHRVLTQPKLRIKPDVFATNRSANSYEKYGGYLPIYEKENAFEYLSDFDQIAIVDADIYIREDAPNIFDDFGTEYAFGAVCEREMPLTTKYKKKITNYSKMQYGNLHNNKLDFKPNHLGFEFYNMGVMLMNSSLFSSYLNGQSPLEFVMRSEFKDFVDGIGNWKWSTDQTMLNYFVKKYKIPTKHMDWKWNGLYTALAKDKVSESHFIHFFLKDLLPEKGENVKELMNAID